jgi:hypothetical protein
MRNRMSRILVALDRRAEAPPIRKPDVSKPYFWGGFPYSRGYAPGRLGRDRTATGFDLEEIHVGKRLLGGLVAVIFLLLLGGPASALAAGGSPLTIATGTHPEDLSVTVTTGGAAIAVWADKSDPTSNVVRWCVLTPGTGSCGGGGILTLAGGPAPQISVNGTQVLDEGSALVILADVEVAKTEFESIQEWQSTNGGQTFTAVNGGKAVASGNPAADTRGINAVTLPGSTSIGVGFHTPSVAPTFHAFSVADPTTCGRATGKCPDGFATLAPESGVDEVSNDPASFAANDDGVLGAFRTNYSTGSLACTDGSPFGMAYVFGDGLQSPANNYNVSPGAAAGAWRKGVTLADCGVDYIAAGGGPSGFGVLEDNQLTGQTQYHRFDGITDTFDTTPVVVSGTGEQQPAVSQDGAGAVYATYLSGGIGGPVSLSYSSDGGATWAGPGTLAADPLGAIAGLTSAVNASGQGWASWTENGSVYLQPFTAADAGTPAPPSPVVTPPASTPAPTTLTTAQKAGGQSGASVTVAAGTTGETDQATIVGANAAHATGTVSYGLYSTATCTAASKVGASTVSVSGATVPSSSPVATALAPGKYYWEVIYGGDFANHGSISACGNEVLTVTSPNTISGAATTDGQTLTFGAACAVVPCTLQATATAPETAASASAAKPHKAKAITLGKGKFRITKKGTRSLTLKLSARGRRYFAGKHGKVKVSLSVSQKVGPHSVVTQRALSVKVLPPRHRP